MREIVAFVLLACACGAASWPGHANDANRAPQARASERETRERPAPPVADADGGGFGALETLGSAASPGMRRAAERETAAGVKVELLKAGERDACLRVAFEAGSPVAAQLVDAEGTVLAATGASLAQGLLPEKGPVCIRKGDAIAAIAAIPAAAATADAGDGGDGTEDVRVRWLVWAAP